MNAITSPVDTRSLFLSLIINFLIWYKCSPKLIGYLFCCLLVAIEFGIPFIVNSFYARHRKRFTNNQFHIWKRFFRPFEKSYIIMPVDLNCSIILPVQLVPYVIYPNQDTQDIGFNTEAICIPSVSQLEYFISGDPFIKHLQVK